MMSPLAVWLLVAAVAFGLLAMSIGVFIALGLALALIVAGGIQPPTAGA